MHPENLSGNTQAFRAGALPDGNREVGHREPMERPCHTHRCAGKIYTVEMREGRHFFVTPFCDACVLDIKRREREAEEEDEKARWLKATTKRWMDAWGGPASAYHKTNFDKLPLPHHSNKALLWTPDEQLGLILVGPSGSGKSRTMYLLLDRLRRERQIIADVQPCIQLRQKIVSAARSRHESDRHDLITQLATAPVLYLDDLGQMNNTDAAAEALLEIVELRHRAELPTLATTQFSDEEFIKTFKQRQTGEAIARRLGESSHIIKFPAIQ